MMKINFQKCLAILISSLLVSGGNVSLSAKSNIDRTYGISFNEKAIEGYCKYSHNSKQCNFHQKYSDQKHTTWDLYKQAYWSVEYTPYWKLESQELFMKYQEVSDDIAYLWSLDPEYEDAKIKASLKKTAISVNVLLVALIGGYAVGGVLHSAGFVVSGNTASLLPIGTSVVQNGVQFSLQSALQYITSHIASGKFWADIGLTMLVLVGDALMVEGAFYTLYTLDEELTGVLRKSKSIEGAVKVRNLIHEIVNPPLSEKVQKSLEKSHQELKQNKKLINDLRQAVQKQFEENKWGIDENTAFLTHYESVVTLYALEHIRAELSDLKDGLRFRKAAVDLAGIYFSDSLTELMDRQELTNLLKLAIDTKREQERLELERNLQNKLLWSQEIYFSRFGAHE